MHFSIRLRVPRSFPAVILTLSCPFTGDTPGAAVKVTVPAVRSTVKSTFSVFSTHSPALFRISTFTAPDSPAAVS